MTRRQNLANAIRQTSLGNSSKMGELLDRFEQGKPCGTPQDIDFLIDEVVKRIEKRLIQRIALLPQTSLNQPSKEEKKVSRAKEKAGGTPTVNETTLRHQARLIVEHILKIAKRHFKESSRKVSSGKKPGSVSITPAKVKALASQNAEEKSRVATKKANTQTGGNRKATRNKPTSSDRRGQVYYRLANTDGESQTTANTYALRKANKSSLRRYSVSHNVKALMCAAEWATSGDMEVVAAPVGRTVANVLPDKVELLQDILYDEPNIRSEITSTKSPRSRAVSSSSKGPSKTKGVGTFLNSSYTYSRRAEIKKALPKFLASRTRDAMMNMFDAIRLAMAEEEIENQDYDFITSLVMRSEEKNSAQGVRPKQRDVNLPRTAETPTSMAFTYENQRDVHSDTSADGGTRDRTFTAMLERHEPEDRMDDFKENTRTSSQSTKQQDKSVIDYMGGLGFQSGTNYTYGMHRDLRRMLPKYTGKRPYNALMHYADNMMVDVYREMVRTGQFVSIPATTSKQATPVYQLPEEEVQVNRSASYYKPVPVVVSAGRSVATQTSKNFGVDSSEDLFCDANLWVPQIAADQENPEIRYAKIQEQKQQQAQREIDEVIYQPAQGTAGDEDAFSPSAFLKENKASTSNLELSRSKDETNTDASHPRVRFADGMKPGEVGEENDETMGSHFFNKLGYYERVGGGELLHKASQRKSRKADAAETTKMEESTAEDSSKPGLSAQENINVLAEREEEEQTEELPAKSTAVEKMCNCL